VSIKTKKELRERILTLLSKHKEEERLNKSLIIEDKLFHLEEFRRANIILFYAAFKGEVETLQMMQRATQLGKRIALPKVCKETKQFSAVLAEDISALGEGAYGIKEPKGNKAFSLKEISGPE